MFTFRKKKPLVDKLKKPIYKKNDDKPTYLVICPYCGAEIREIYFTRVTDVEFTNCEKCGKKFA